jgi:ABC-type transport system involved in multi-copper enzyme maturation permease subunit
MTAAPSSLVARLTRDPNAIWMREMRQAARLGRTPWILFALVLVLTLFLASVGGIAAASNASPAELGGALYQTFFSLAYLVVVLVGPAVAANGIAAEREGRTWEAVLLTGMKPVEIARGKFLAAYTTIALYIVALAPVGALSFLFGGVTATEVAIAFAYLFAIAGLAVAFGLAVSSLMTSLRGAIVVTLMLAIAVGPTLYALGGFTASLGVHRLWPEVPEAMPIWLPLAYERAKLGVTYLVVLVALPLLVLAVPAWFLYEATIANLTGDAEDRSTGLKRWFAVCSPLLAMAAATPSLLASDAEGRSVLCMLGLFAYLVHHGLCTLLFASEPPGPSRRVEVRWERTGAGRVRRFFGPGLSRTMTLVTLVSLAGLALVAVVDATGLALAHPLGVRKELEEIVVFAAYAASVAVLVVGVVSWTRSRGPTAWVARVVTVGVLFLIAAVPWVVAAIAGALSESRADDWLAIASPSPFYVLAMVTMIERASAEAPLVVGAGIACAALWAVVGLALLALASRRCARLVAEYREAARRADEALAAEERALAQGSAEPAPEAPAPGTTP